MAGFIVKGALEPVQGLSIANFRDDPSLQLASEDCRIRRTSWVRAIVLHTTMGLPKEPTDPRQFMKPGKGPATRAGKRINNYWKGDGRCAGAHLLVDYDGSISQHADLADMTTFHAGPVNDVSIGLEILQGADASMYEGQLDAVVDLVDWLTRRFSIQRQIPTAYQGKPIARLINGGANVVGVYGHRDVTDTRGQGDPGDLIFNKLKDAGYETLDFATSADIKLWKQRQAEYGVDVRHADGIPGLNTVKALAAAGHSRGLLIARPGDR